MGSRLGNKVVLLLVLGGLSTAPALGHCPNDVSPSSATISAAGGTSSFNITTDPGCPWALASSVAWIDVVSASPVAGKSTWSGISSAKITFTVARNSAVERRTGYISVSGNLYTLTQDGATAAAADLALSISHSEHFTVGFRGAYSLAVSNAGSLPSSGLITLTDALPEGLIPVSAQGPGWNCSLSSTGVVCQYPAALAPQATAGLTVAVDVSELAAPAVVNRGGIANSSDAFPENNVAIDPTLVAFGEVTVLGPGIPVAGSVSPLQENLFPCAFSRAQYAFAVPSDAAQLIVSLTGDPGAGLLVSGGSPVPLSSSPNADFAALSAARFKTIYAGPTTRPALEPGVYYVAVSNCSRSEAGFTLRADVITPASPVKVQELAVDDGTQESGLLGDGTLGVNRFKPDRYPSRLKAVRVYFANFEFQPDPEGQQIRLIAFGDPAGGGRPPGAPTLLVDQVVTVSGAREYIEFPLENGPILFSGDWYVGFQHSTPLNGAVISSDTNGAPQGASFYSIDGGSTFFGPAFSPSQPMNFMIRAVVEDRQTSRRKP